MEEQILPIIPGNGKYAGKSITELMADKWYVDNVLKKEENKTWFNPNNKNWGPIYNIIVNQTISTNKDGKSPEHNKLQNLFLEQDNQQKLLSKLFKIDLDVEVLNNLFADEDIVRCFGINKISKIINNLEKTSVKFEEKFNWDLVLYYKDRQTLLIESNLETELIDKEIYKEKYDIKQNENHENNILLIDKLIEAVKKLYQDKIYEYEEKIKDYQDKYTKYNDDLKNYLQQKEQNENDITNYENKLKIYKNKLDKYITPYKKQICLDLGINYDYFMNWDTQNYNFLKLDKDNEHTTEEKKRLQDIVVNKLEPFYEIFHKKNKIPIFVEKLNMPIKLKLFKPTLPIKPEKNIDFYTDNSDICKLYDDCYNIKIINNNCSIDNIYEYKKEYIEEYKNKKYENKKFNEDYEKYRKQYYRDIINRYCNKNVDVNVYCDIHNKKTGQYCIYIDICYFNYAVLCELKPTLSDDYPCVLRKLKAQIELTNNDKTTFKGLDKKMVLLIGSFTSAHTSKEQLITIFKQSNIEVIFTDEIFEPSKTIVITNTQEISSKNKLIEENKILIDNLLETQQKLLQVEEKNKQLEEKNKQLEEQILSLKTQKQSKNIKDYFGKK